MAKRIGVQLQYEVFVRDKDGKVLSRSKGICRSWVANFLRWVNGWFTTGVIAGYGDVYTMNDIGNTGRTMPYTSTGYQGINGRWRGAVGIVDVGIVVGTGTTPTTINDVALGTRIAHGAGGGQLVYNAQTSEALVVSAPNATVRHTRTFTNNSGASITVNEIGWYIGAWDSTSTERFFCMVHDLLASPQAIPNGATLTVRYTVSVTN